MDQVDGGGRWLERAEHPDECPGSFGFCEHLIREDARHSEARDGRVDRRLCRIDHEPRTDGDRDGRLGTLEDPSFGRRETFERDAVVPAQIVGLFRGSSFRKVRGAAAYDPADCADARCDQAAVRQLADTNRHVDAVLEEIHHAIRKHHADVDVSERSQELRDHSAALGKGALPAATRERIALAVAEINGCSYCLSAHTYLAKNLAKLDEAEMAKNRSGASGDPKADAAVRFAAKIARERGHVDVSDMHALKAAGYDDAQLIEIVLHVALNTWTNYLNEVAKTDVDFPLVAARAAA
jgi:AhpD family alkylhydroperoxidase